MWKTLKNTIFIGILNKIKKKFKVFEWVKMKGKVQSDWEIAVLQSQLDHKCESSMTQTNKGVPVPILIILKWNSWVCAHATCTCPQTPTPWAWTHASVAEASFRRPFLSKRNMSKLFAKTDRFCEVKLFEGQSTGLDSLEPQNEIKSKLTI